MGLTEQTTKAGWSCPRTACIGAGYWGKNLVRNLKSLGALGRVCEPDPRRQAELMEVDQTLSITDSVDDVLGDPDTVAVVIATPAGTHGDLVMRALKAGKDVFVEKPLCLSVPEGEDLVALARQTSRILMVGHLLWYHPAIVKLQEIIEHGELGRIQYICSNRLNLGRIRREENILWSFAPHDVSLILGLVGEMPDIIEAQGGNYLHDHIADVSVSLFSFPSGIRAHIFVSWLHPFKEQKLVVIGDRQMAVFDDSEPVHKLSVYPHSIRWENHFPIVNKAQARPVTVRAAEPLREECTHFLECVASRRSPRTDGVEGLKVLTVLQRCQEALEKSPRRSNSKSLMAKQKKQQGYFAHPSAFIDDDVVIGEGTVIWHVSHIMKETRIGSNCRIGQNVVIGPRAIVGNGVKIQNNVSVYEGVTLEDAVFCGPSMVFTNVYNPRSEVRRMDQIRPTLVRQGATLGANCTVVCGITIGRYAFVGAGTVVVRDIPDHALVVGNPGRIIGWMCTCGNRIKFDLQESSGSCLACRQTYLRIGNEVTIVEQSALARP